MMGVSVGMWSLALSIGKGLCDKEEGSEGNW